MSSPVYRAPGAGSLHQGSDRSARYVLEHPRSVDLLVLCAAELQHEVDDPAAIGIPLNDVELRSARDKHAYLDAGLRVAQLCAERILSGGRVLTCCAMGLNRSGLISGLTLRCLGVSAETAIALVRSARGHMALSNRSFESLVREAAPALARSTKRRGSTA